MKKDVKGLGILDIAKPSTHVGCEELTKILGKTIKPLYHIFGHIHEAYGMEKHEDITYINASICTLRYKPSNKPITFTLPVKEDKKEKVEGEEEQKAEDEKEKKQKVQSEKEEKGEANKEEKEESS